MPRYVVTWQIEVDAASDNAAGDQATAFFRHRKISAIDLSVTESGQKPDAEEIKTMRALNSERWAKAQAARK